MEDEERKAEIRSVATAAAWSAAAYFDPRTAHEPIGRRGYIAAILATFDKLPNEEQLFLEDPIDELRYWPSTIASVDRRYGGFCGVSTLIGGKGIGKTMLAFASALQAAATMEWNVFYFGAEIDMMEMHQRRAREFSAHESALDGVDYLTMIHVGLGQRPIDFCLDIGESYDPELPILVVIDSINSCAVLSKRDYLRTIEEFGLWAMMARRLSRGAVSFLLVSETNKAGNSKGEKLEFWSDFALKMKGQKDPNSPAVDFSVAKLRHSRHIPIPLLCRCVGANRFYDESELQRIHHEIAEQRQLRLV